jgi:hypothetical protein
VRCEWNLHCRKAAGATDSGAGGACAGIGNDSAGRRFPDARELNLRAESHCYRWAARLPRREAGSGPRLPMFPAQPAALRGLDMYRSRVASAAKPRNTRQKNSGRCHHKADKTWIPVLQKCRNTVLADNHEDGTGIQDFGRLCLPRLSRAKFTTTAAIETSERLFHALRVNRF